jgi:hypothetical protein
LTEEDSEEEEEEEEDTVKEVKLRAGVGKFRALSPRAARPPTRTRTPTPSAPPSPSPEITVEPESQEPEAEPDEEVKYPPLPRHLSQFRQSPWFKHHFPLATSKTFNFLRPPPKEGILQQIPFSAVVDLLIGDRNSVGSGLLFETKDAMRM